MNSPVVSNGDTIGDCILSALARRGLLVLSGDGGACGYLAGDCCRLGDPDARPWRWRLLRLRSRILVVRLMLSSEAGDSVRQGTETFDGRLLSLSLASLSL